MRTTMRFGAGSGSGLGRYYRQLFGAPNLLKRLQAKLLIRSVAQSPNSRILDYGCASGYMSVEFAKRSAVVIGVDSNFEVTTLKVPRKLGNKLSFIQADSPASLYSFGNFDVVLLSDVINMTQEPSSFLKELAECVDSNGKLVISQGLGRPEVRRLFQERGLIAKLLRRRLAKRGISNFEKYEAFLQESFGNPIGSFIDELSLIEEINSSESFQIDQIIHPVPLRSGLLFELQQAVRVGLGLNPVRTTPFLVLFPLLKIAGLWDKRRWDGAVLLEISVRNQS